MASGKKVRRNVGDIVKIPLSDGSHSYAIVLPAPRFAFLDYRGRQELPAADVVRVQPLFQLLVMDYAVTSGRWPRIGHVQPPASFLQFPVFFKQDPINKKYSLYTGNGREVPATREQCEGLERYAVWDPEHVEERLLDHYSGRPNRWVEASKIR
jgi:hypothetical protein